MALEGALTLHYDTLKTSNLRSTYTTFLRNKNAPIHRWFFYPEGFSGDFVEECIQKFNLRKGNVILDPFVGSGTTLVSAKLNGIDSIGIDISPLMCFISRMKTTLEVDASELKAKMHEFVKKIQPILLSAKSAKNLLLFSEHLLEKEENFAPSIEVPRYSQMNRYFSDSVMSQLLLLKEHILKWEDDISRDFLKLAFASILIEVSNMKRMPDLTFDKSKKKVVVFSKFRNKVDEICLDLCSLRSKQKVYGKSKVLLGDARHMENAYVPANSIDLIITSPPYIGHGDYVKNTKIELWFLDFVKSEEEMKALRNNMIVASHRVSKEKLRERTLYSDDALEDCCVKLAKNPPSWFPDAHFMVRKFFDDMHQVFVQMHRVMQAGRHIVFVVGDSQFASIPVPTHTICSNIAQSVGFNSVELKTVRKRRTGAVRKTKGGFNLDFELAEYLLIAQK
jgi:tRNA G10  N-methylase Trm11